MAPATLGERVAASKEPVARDRSIRLEPDLAQAPPANWDPLLVEQALGNLLDNALDFSPPGSILRLTGQPLPGGYRYRVIDQGPGIPDYALPRVFERFYSLPRPERGKSSGLGLCFAREVARQHGGDLHLTNLPQGGLQAQLWLTSP